MVTQAELFKSLKQKGTASSTPLPDFIGFKQEGQLIRGIVTDVYVTTVWDKVAGGPKKDKNGNDVPQLNITLKMEDGELKRQSFANDLLWKLTAALEALGLEEVPIGYELASKWTGMHPPKTTGGYSARDHQVGIRKVDA